ncbi:hypothetical protein ACEPAG_2575 [Sanghuangporus baumii]
MFTRRAGKCKDVEGVVGSTGGTAEDGKEDVGVPGKEILALQAKTGGATGESSAETLLDSSLDCKTGPVANDRADPLGCFRGSTVLLSGESVFKGGRLALEAGGNNDADFDALKGLGSKLGAKGLRVGALCEVENGGAASALTASEEDTRSSSPSDRRSPTSARLRNGFVSCIIVNVEDVMEFAGLLVEGGRGETAGFGGSTILRDVELEVAGTPNTGPPNTFGADWKVLKAVPKTDEEPCFPITAGVDEELTILPNTDSPTGTGTKVVWVVGRPKGDAEESSENEVSYEKPRIHRSSSRYLDLEQT